MAKRARARGHRVAMAVTLLYLAAAICVPLYLSEQNCRTGLTHASPFMDLANNWLSCHLREDHLDVGAYGNWLAGTLLIPVLFWIYGAVRAQEAAAEEQRRAIFVATIPLQHERFERLAGRIGEALNGERHDGAALEGGPPGRDRYAIPAVNTMILRGLRASSVELKSTLRRTACTEEYVAEGRLFLEALRRYDLPAYSGGAWRDLMRTLEKF